MKNTVLIKGLLIALTIGLLIPGLTNVNPVEHQVENDKEYQLRVETELREKEEKELEVKKEAERVEAAKNAEQTAIDNLVNEFNVMEDRLLSDVTVQEIKDLIAKKDALTTEYVGEDALTVVNDKVELLNAKIARKEKAIEDAKVQAQRPATNNNSNAGSAGTATKPQTGGNTSTPQPNPTPAPKPVAPQSTGSYVKVGGMTKTMKEFTSGTALQNYIDSNRDNLAMRRQGAGYPNIIGGHQGDAGRAVMAMSVGTIVEVKYEDGTVAKYEITDFREKSKKYYDEAYWPIMNAADVMFETCVFGTDRANDGWRFIALGKRI